MPQKSKLSLCLIYNGYYNSAEDVAEHFHDDTELIFIRHGSCSIGIPGEKTLLCLSCRNRLRGTGGTAAQPA